MCHLPLLTMFMPICLFTSLKKSFIFLTHFSSLFDIVDNISVDLSIQNNAN